MSPRSFLRCLLSLRILFLIHFHLILPFFFHFLGLRFIGITSLGLSSRSPFLSFSHRAKKLLWTSDYAVQGPENLPHFRHFPPFSARQRGFNGCFLAISGVALSLPSHPKKEALKDKNSSIKHPWVVAYTSGKLIYPSAKF